MVAEVFAGLGSIKVAFDIAKGLKNIDDATRRNAAIIELQEKILTAQETQSSLIERVSELEKEVTRMKDWEADKRRYQLTEVAPGIVALSVKEPMRNGEPFHRICANCASGGKKVYLQRHPGGSGYYRYRCNACSEELIIQEGKVRIGLVGYGGADPEDGSL